MENDISEGHPSIQCGQRESSFPLFKCKHLHTDFQSVETNSVVIDWHIYAHGKSLMRLHRVAFK